MAQGLFYPNGEFKSDQQIKREALVHNFPIFHTPLPEKKDFHYWSEVAKIRQRQGLETEEFKNSVEISLPHRSLLNLMADLHIGGLYTDYARIEAEIQKIVETQNSYLILVGDVVDNFFFNPAQQEDVVNVTNQWQYANALMEYVASQGKLLCAWCGNHDLWASKTGENPYADFSARTGAYLMHGVGYVKLNVGEQTYKLCGNHMFKGNSVYSNAHPQRRALNESARGSDVVFSGHWHQKAIVQQAFTEFGGDNYLATMVALGTYKASDEYVRTYGFENRTPQSMYGASLLFDDQTKTVLPFYDILQANDIFAQMQIAEVEIPQYSQLYA